MKRKLFLKRPSMSSIEKDKRLFDLQMGWYVASNKEMYQFSQVHRICPLCKHSYSTKSFPFDYCANCKTELVFYRGPFYLKLRLNEEKFIAESVRDNSIIFTTLTRAEDIPSIDIMVAMSASWPALMRSYDYTTGIYEGFCTIKPSSHNMYATRNLTGVFLTPFQAGFMERYSIVEKSYNHNMVIRRKKEYQKEYYIPKTFTDLYELGVFDVKDEDSLEFFRMINIGKDSFFKSRDKLVRRSISQQPS